MNLPTKIIISVLAASVILTVASNIYLFKKVSTVLSNNADYERHVGKADEETLEVIRSAINSNGEKLDLVKNEFSLLKPVSSDVEVVKDQTPVTVDLTQFSKSFDVTLNEISQKIKSLQSNPLTLNEDVVLDLENELVELKSNMKVLLDSLAIVNSDLDNELSKKTVSNDYKTETAEFTVVSDINGKMNSQTITGFNLVSVKTPSQRIGVYTGGQTRISSDDMLFDNSDWKVGIFYSNKDWIVKTGVSVLQEKTYEISIGKTIFEW